MGWLKGLLKARVLIPSALAAAVLAALSWAVFTWTAGLLPPDPARLVLDAGLDRPEDASALDRVLQRFRNLYPHIQVEVRAAAAGAAPADVLVRSGLAVTTEAFAAPPQVWTGTLWLLAARKDRLDEVYAKAPETVDALRAGQATPEAFTRLLDTLAESGKAPLTLGNSHRWPLLLWLQHWLAATQGPDSSQNLPALPLSPEQASAWQTLTDWRKRGLFEASTWSEGWARGLRPLLEGEAVFALVSADYMGPLSQAPEGLLEFLPFPRRSPDEAWSIGSAAFIGAHESSAAPQAAALLVRFLTSPGVTAELTRLTGRPYFGWAPQTGTPPRVLPAWPDAAGTAPYEALLRFLGE